MGDERIAVVGGTGKLGRGLALRLAVAGHPVLIGSRDAARAEAAAAQLRDVVTAGTITGADNAAACAAADVVFVSVPYEAQAATLAPLAAACAGKVVVCCTVPMAFAEGGPVPVMAAGGSAAQECAAALPGARVVAGFQWVPAPTLARLDGVLDMDVPLCGDDEDALAVAVGLVGEIEGLRAVVAGPLRLAVALESLTPLLVSINRRHKTHAGVRLTGLA